MTATSKKNEINACTSNNHRFDLFNTNYALELINTIVIALKLCRNVELESDLAMAEYTFFKRKQNL